MNKLFILLALMSLFHFSGISQEKRNEKLEAKLQDMLKGFQGEIGIYVKDLRRNKIASVNADTIFPTASMVKIPILIGIMDKLENGALQYHQELIYKDSLLYEGVDILGSFKNDEKIELGKLVMLMLTMSDNTASLWLQSLAGSGERINRILDSLGFSQTRINSRTPGRENQREIYGWGQTTPREMATLFEKILRKEILNKKQSEKMLRLTSRNYWDEVCIAQVPPEIFVASKNGAVDDSRSEVLYVNAPHHPYIFCICTKNNKDSSWDDSNEAWKLERKISAFLWNYFEPGYGWKPD